MHHDHVSWLLCFVVAAQRPLVDKLINDNTHYMMEGSVSVYFLIFFYRLLETPLPIYLELAFIGLALMYISYSVNQ